MYIYSWAVPSPWFARPSFFSEVIGPISRLPHGDLKVTVARDFWKFLFFLQESLLIIVEVTREFLLILRDFSQSYNSFKTTPQHAGHRGLRVNEFR